MEKLLLVCLGGALGSGTRYLVGHWSVTKLGTAFPWGTLAVNVIGCFAIALVMHVSSVKPEFQLNWRLFVTTGLLGGFTTYSAFNQETLSYFETGELAKAFGYAAVTLLAGLAAGYAGLNASRAMFG
ncbi:MAG: fluoride efflux transporter CrcB [Planctomycetes bacterium]|nr:fluoride efflux transporter CrcB [Planctomycetota bacterium]